MQYKKATVASSGMPSLASSIFKIRAHSDFISSDPNLLSFRKGQPFYALSVDEEKQVYFVSTQFAVPFSRTAVCGMVPKAYFDQVDLMAKDPPVKKSRPVVKPAPPVYVPTRRQSMTHNADCQKLVGQQVSFVQVLAIRKHQQLEMVRIQITRGQVSHIVERDTTECFRFHQSLLSQIPITHLPEFPSLDPVYATTRQQRLEVYFNSLIVQPYSPNPHSTLISEYLDNMFTPRDAQELVQNPVTRRDSGHSVDEKPNKRKNSFAKFASMVFGSN